MTAWTSASTANAPTNLIEGGMAANRPACHHPLVVIPAKAGIHLPSLVLGVTKMGGQPLLLSMTK